MEVSIPVTHPRTRHVHVRPSGHGQQQRNLTTCLHEMLCRRSLRLVMFTFFCVSATVGAVIATTQVFGALRGAEDALPLNDVATVSPQASVLSELRIPPHQHARSHLRMASTGMRHAKCLSMATLRWLECCCSHWRWTWEPSQRSPFCCGET